MIQAYEKDSKLYLGAFVNKSSVCRDDFSLNVTAKLNDISHTLSKKSNEFEVGTGWGWGQFLELDKLFNPALNYLNKNSAINLVMEVNFRIKQQTCVYTLKIKRILQGID